jgi:hypothetical protein
VEFLAIQETKLEIVTDSVCYAIWGDNNCKWAYLPATGSSGGILSLWNKSIFSLIFSFIGDGFVGVCLEWGASKKICYIVNVYYSCDLTAKRRLWDNLLMSKGGFGGGAWCVVGDFNVVLHRDERKGMNRLDQSAASPEIVEFRDFVNRMGLFDMPVIGRRFTWMHPNGLSMSRIDRDLVSDDWLLLGENPALWVLPRTVSDHCPLVLRFNVANWGPRSFRFNNY